MLLVAESCHEVRRLYVRYLNRRDFVVVFVIGQ